MVYQIDDIVILNDRDRRVLSWLKSQFADEQILQALANISGQRKPFLSNVCKVLGVTVPDTVLATPAGQARKHLDAAKALLATKLG